MKNYNKWKIRFVPSRYGHKRGWLVDTVNGVQYSFNVVKGEVSIMRVVTPTNIPAYVIKRILEGKDG